MAYIQRNGTLTTLRALFSKMEPMAHAPEPENSKVLAHIMEVLGCDLNRAKLSFDSMRGLSSRVLVFDRTHSIWHGCEWLPEESSDPNRSIMRRINKSDRQTDNLKIEIRKLKRRVDEMAKALEYLIESRNGTTPSRNETRKAPKQIIEEPTVDQNDQNPDPENQDGLVKGSFFDYMLAQTNGASGQTDACTEAGSTRPN